MILRNLIKNPLRKVFQFLGGTVSGIYSTYDVGAAVSGEDTKNGKQKLTYSRGFTIDQMIEKDLDFDSAVMFSLLNGKEMTLSQMLHPNTVHPFHAGNTARGFFKVQREAKNISLLSAGTTLVAGALTKNLLVQTITVIGATGFYGAHRGNQTIVKIAHKTTNDADKTNDHLPSRPENHK